MNQRLFLLIPTTASFLLTAGIAGCSSTTGSTKSDGPQANPVSQTFKPTNTPPAVANPPEQSTQPDPNLSYTKYLSDADNALREHRYVDLEKIALAQLSTAESFGEQDPRLIESLQEVILVYDLEGKFADEVPVYDRILKLAEAAKSDKLVPLQQGYAKVLGKLNPQSTSDVARSTYASGKPNSSPTSSATPASTYIVNPKRQQSYDSRRRTTSMSGEESEMIKDWVQDTIEQQLKRQRSFKDWDFKDWSISKDESDYYHVSVSVYVVYNSARGPEWVLDGKVVYALIIQRNGSGSFAVVSLQSSEPEVLGVSRRNSF